MIHPRDFIIFVLLYQQSFCVVVQSPPRDDSQVLRFPNDDFNPGVKFPPNENTAAAASEYDAIYVSKDPTLAGDYQKSDTPQCPSKHTGLLPHPADCRKFVNCFKGRGFIQLCSPGTLFNSVTLECDYPAKALCASNRRDDLNPDEINEVDGEVSLHNPNTVLDESGWHSLKKREIQPVSNSRSNYINSGGPQNVGMTEAFFPDLEKNTKPSAKESDGSLKYSDDGTVIFPSDDTARYNKKRQSGKSVEKAKCPPGANGPHPHPNTCKKYLSCANGRTFEMDCAPGTLFNPDLSVCDFPYNVDCDEDDLTPGGHNTELPPAYRNRNTGYAPGAAGSEAQYSPDTLDNRNSFFSTRGNGPQFTNEDELLPATDGYDPPVKGYGAQKKPNKNVPLQLSGDDLTSEGTHHRPASASIDRSQGSRAHTQPNPPNYNTIQRQPIKPKPYDASAGPGQTLAHGKNEETVPYGTRTQPPHNRINAQPNKPLFNPNTHHGQPNTLHRHPSNPSINGQNNQPKPYGQSNNPTPYDQPYHPTPDEQTNQQTPHVQPNNPTPYGQSNQPTPYGQPNNPTTYGQPNQQTPYDQPNNPTPYGQPNQPTPYGQPKQQTPYVQPNNPTPYGQPNQPTPYVQPNNPTPYGQPNQPTPYGQPNQQTAHGPPSNPTPYGQPNQPTPYGETNQPTPYGQPNQPTPYGQPNQPTPYGQPNQPTPYGQPNQPTPYGQPNQPTPYGQPNQPTPYGQPNQPTPYGQPNQPTPYGQPNQPTPYGQPNQPTPYGQPNQPTPYGQPNQPTPYGLTNQGYPCGKPNTQTTYSSSNQPSPYSFTAQQPNIQVGNQNPNVLYPPSQNTHDPNECIEKPPQQHGNQPTTLTLPENQQYQPNGQSPSNHQPNEYNPTYGSPQQPNVQQGSPHNTLQPNEGYDRPQSKSKTPKKNNSHQNKQNQNPTTPASQHNPTISTLNLDLLPPYEEATEADPNDFRILVDDLPQNETDDGYQEPTQDFDIESSSNSPQGGVFPVYSVNNKRDLKSKVPATNSIPTYVVPSKKPISRQMVRLRGGSKPSEGFLEMKSSAGTEWGLVCDEPNGWNKNEADIICQQLGYSGGADLTWQGRPSSSQNTTLKKPSIVKVECSGREASILDCKLVKGRTCDVEKDSLWIRCLGNHASQCRPGEVSYNNKCYSLVLPSEEASSANDSVGFSHSEAMKHCQTKGGHLLDIASQKENDFLSEWLTHQDQLPSIMTSGVGVSVMGRPIWIWEGSEEAFVHQNWWPGWEAKTAMSPQPQTMRALCVVLKRYYDCPAKEAKVETTKGDPTKPGEGIRCDSEYFFWDTEDCGSLTTTHPYICKRPVDDIGCIKDTGKDYKGNANVTRSGFNCLPWDNPMVIPALEFEVSQHSRKAILSGHDHCRNPDGTEAMPWCFILTNVGIDKDYCDIPACRTKDTAKIIEARALTDPTDGSCGANLFQCEAKECIPKLWVCDGQADCLNGLDEQNCTDSVIKFAHQPAAKLEGHDKEKWMHSTVSNCANKCVESKEFECLSFSFSIKDKTCLLSDHNVGSSGSLAINQPDWDYYELNSKSINCEGKFLCQNGKCINKAEMCNGFNNCGDRSDEMNCPNIELGYEVRLSSGTNMSHYGRLEVKVFGEWGLVCDDKFGMKDADVICRELGFKMGAAETYTHTQAPTINGTQPLTLPILMDEVECTGNETSLKDCAFNGWGIHDCGPEEVAGVICSMPGMKCKTNFWQCQNSQECIPQAFLCDGTKDCDDHSDEDGKTCASVRSTTPAPPKQSVQRIAKKTSAKS